MKISWMDGRMDRGGWQDGDEGEKESERDGKTRGFRATGACVGSVTGDKEKMPLLGAAAWIASILSIHAF